MHLIFFILVCDGLEAYERNENFRTTPKLPLTATPTNVNFRPLLRWRRPANIIALRSLIDARIKFKIATLTFKALNTGNPPYLASSFIGTTRVELYDPLLLTYCPSHDPTYHLAPVPFALLFQLSGTVSLLMSALVLLSQHSVII